MGQLCAASGLDLDAATGTRIKYKGIVAESLLRPLQRTSSGSSPIVSTLIVGARTRFHAFIGATHFGLPQRPICLPGFPFCELPTDDGVPRPPLPGGSSPPWDAEISWGPCRTDVLGTLRCDSNGNVAIAISPNYAPESSCKRRCGLTNCLLEHEQQHMDDLVDFFSEWVAAIPCQPGQCLRQNASLHHWMECRGYWRGFQCIQNVSPTMSIPGCCCEWEVRSYKAIEEREGRNHCLEAGLGWWH